VSYFYEAGIKLRPVREDIVRFQTSVCIFFLTLLFSIACAAQNLPTRPGLQIPPDKAETAEDDTQRQLAHDLAKKLNEQRQKALETDTDKLVKLTAELKEYVEKSNQNVLSLDVVRKAEEIEKLARSVKEKMKGAN
jgi:hypothetical protein